MIHIKVVLDRVFGGAIRTDGIDRMVFRAGKPFRLAIGHAE
jgi:hypothetical protein